MVIQVRTYVNTNPQFLRNAISYKMFLLRAKYKQKKKANIDNMRTVTQLHIKKYASLDNSFSHIKINRNKFLLL